MAHTLVLGLGNTLLSDDGAGVHALRCLQTSIPDSDGLECLDGGTLSFSLLPAIEQAGSLIVLDATEMNAEPGTVCCFEGVELDGLLARPRRSVHEVSLLDLLSSARLSGTLPAHRALVGVQPARIAWGDTLSPAVAGAIPWMIEVALEWRNSWADTGCDRPNWPRIAKTAAPKPTAGNPYERT